MPGFRDRGRRALSKQPSSAFGPLYRDRSPAGNKSDSHARRQVRRDSRSRPAGPLADADTTGPTRRKTAPKPGLADAGTGSPPEETAAGVRPAGGSAHRAATGPANRSDIALLFFPHNGFRHSHGSGPRRTVTPPEWALPTEHKPARSCSAASWPLGRRWCAVGRLHAVLPSPVHVTG
ncbi:hypothetical protein ACFPN7_26240 [Amycolatopsis halotolerans]|uniref:hypothetical protein n=1 Tax=Amycolatopsis halotolerans TaxID=330083 RepID=UPI003612B3CC